MTEMIVGEWVMSCDFCDEEYESNTTDFMEMISEAKSEGWKIFKDERGSWTHKCPKCSRKRKN